MVSDQQNEVHGADPLHRLEIEVLHIHIKRLYDSHFKNTHSVTEKELQIGARLARNYGDHQLDLFHGEEFERASDERGSFTSSMDSVTQFMGAAEARALMIQGSNAFWKEPKDLFLTLLVCFTASFTQGWDQAANGNSGWPEVFGIASENDRTGNSTWKIVIISAIPWFSAAVLGALFNLLSYSNIFGRRNLMFVSASLSFASMVGGSQAKSWQTYLVSRLFLGIGIGIEASIVPIWESEMVPPAKRGRFLVLSQIATAIGVFAGSIVSYIFRNQWRIQVISGALPALILLTLIYAGSESPRWLIVKAKYVEAFHTLLRLRKERILAAEELCYTYFQVQAERAFYRQHKPDLNHLEPDLSFRERLYNLFFHLARGRRAAFVAMIIMLAQQFCGISIVGFLANVLFSPTGSHSQPTNSHIIDSLTQTNNDDGLLLTIGFSAACAVFSIIAFFLVEPPPMDIALDEAFYDSDDPPDRTMPDTGRASILWKKIRWLICGRRSLMLISLTGTTAILFMIIFLLTLHDENPARVPVIICIIILYAFFYSPGAGCVPYLYSSEIWPNEGREIGMSWAVFWNYMSSGLLTTFIPQGFQWGSSKLFGIFTGFSFLALVMVYLFVPPIEHGLSLGDMEFNVPLLWYARSRVEQLRPRWKMDRVMAESATETIEVTAVPTATTADTPKIESHL